VPASTQVSGPGSITFADFATRLLTAKTRSGALMRATTSSWLFNSRHMSTSSQTRRMTSTSSLAGATRWPHATERLVHPNRRAPAAVRVARRRRDASVLKVPFRLHETLASSKVAGWASPAHITFAGDRRD
jgi:hypothetical protein